MNGREILTITNASPPQTSINKAPGADSTIPLALLQRFVSTPIELTGTMSQGSDGNAFELDLSFTPQVEAPEPTSLLVLAVGLLATWMVRVRRSRLAAAD